MKQKYELTEADIKRAIALYIMTENPKVTNVEYSKVYLSASANIDDRYGTSYGHTISATVDVQ
jgi:hypothetical protein